MAPAPERPTPAWSSSPSDDGEADRLARNAVDDVQRYWSEVLPATFGRRFAPVTRLISYDSTGPGVTVCGSGTQGAVNAFYCPADDAVAWDRRQLLPVLNDSFGPRSTTAEATGDLPMGDREWLLALLETLRAAFDPGSATATRPTIDRSLSACPEVTVTTPVAYCPATGTIGLDLAELARLGTSPEQGRGGIGDFGAFAEVASRYALAVQHAAGFPLTGLATAQRTACLTGFWAAAVVAGQGAALRLSPGDLDEAVAEMLAPRSLIAADVNGAGIPSGFARVEAFRDGFTAGTRALCLAKYR